MQLLKALIDEEEQHLTMFCIAKKNTTLNPVLFQQDRYFLQRPILQ
ncbi:MAG: hypothetical protein J0H29_00830 [Sphingobacteriales bacterium]|nr:hypothetical protein [Sphingobacteriales bacterium]